MKYLKVGGFNITDPDYGIWFFLHTSYSYALFIIGTVLLIKNLIRQPAIYRKQSIIMGLGALIPFIGNLIYTLNILPTIMDLSVLSFAITGMMFFWAMYKYKLFDLVPAAREKVIESMDEIIVVLDSKDRIIDINFAGKKTLCHSTNIIGEQFLTAVGEYSVVFEKHMHSVRTSKKLSLVVEGSKKYFNFKIHPLFDSKSNINGKFIIMHDISSLDESMKKLNEARKAAEEANKAKSAFLASMSHEIRTPLNGIIGMAHLLETANLNREEYEYLKSINYSADSLLQIINDILDFSKIEAQKMELEKTAFNLKELMSTIINSFLYMKEEKDISLLLDVDADVPDTLLGDPVRLRQILINLIGNAFKFTSKGTIKTSVKKIKEAKDFTELKFSVSDTGIGIPKSKIDNLFESFKQLDSATTRK
jgi:signal transduction histidine kinase